MDDIVLATNGLTVAYRTGQGESCVVNGVSVSVKSGEVLGLVGESGSGKSTIVQALIGLVRPPGRITAGEVWFEGQDLASESDKELEHVRGAKIGFVGSRPHAELNPLQRVGTQISRVYQTHTGAAPDAARQRTESVLASVGINDVERRYDAYPHELSIGMAQRVSIAMALVCDPQLFLLDDPTSSLDVTIQAQVLEILRAVGEERAAATVIATRDLGIVAQYCTTVAVLYAGRVVESSDVETFFAEPLHPYSKALMNSVSLDPAGRTRIGGPRPDPRSLPTGCYFHPRCPLAESICSDVRPNDAIVKPRHMVACHVVEEQYAAVRY